MANNVQVSDELLAELQTEAAAEGKSPDEIVNLAIQRFLLHRRLEDLVDYGNSQSARQGLTEGDVPRLIEEHRQNKSQL